MAFRSTKMGQFTYFSQQVGEALWHGKNVLDFGGNIGNMLRDPNSTIDEERYWCIDVVKDSIEQGKLYYPKSHWVFYDRYCFAFNPHGVPNLTFPDLHQTFDYIVAYSVFTNTAQSEMLQLVNHLVSLLAKDGLLAFTFIDPHHCSWPGQYHGDNFQWRLEGERKTGGVSTTTMKDLIKKAQHADWFTLVNANDLYLETEDIQACEPERQKTYFVFYSEKYMKALFPNATILPPANNEMQHCCVIRRTPGIN